MFLQFNSSSNHARDVPAELSSIQDAFNFTGWRYSENVHPCQEVVPLIARSISFPDLLLGTFHAIGTALWFVLLSK